MSEKDLVKKEEENVLASQTEGPMGFDDDDEEDFIVPRVKIVQTLSPERKEKLADEGDIINSLTKEKLNGKVFIPVFMFKNNIWWIDRSEGGGIKCIARDGKVGHRNNGEVLPCAQCRLNEFDNTKQGRDAIPKCTKYMNFFGFFRGEQMPIILSFAKTNYNEGKKLYSLAKVTMQNMWNHGYTLNEKLVSKGGNEWYIIDVSPSGKTTDEEREYGMNMFKSFRNRSDLKIDMEEDIASSSDSGLVSDEDVENAEF